MPSPFSRGGEPHRQGEHERHHLEKDEENNAATGEPHIERDGESPELTHDDGGHDRDTCVEDRIHLITIPTA